MNLKPCPFRHVDEDGNILCDKIKTGDKQVSPNICRDCPIAAINCSHLRATLDHSSRPPITVRYGNGKTAVWDDMGGPAIALERAACAAKVVPIHSPRDCAGCPLRHALVTPEMMTPMTSPTAPVPAPRVTVTQRRTRSAPPHTVAPTPAPAPIAPPAAEKRESIVAQKIIQLQDWLAKQQKSSAQNQDEQDDAPITRGTFSAHREPRPPANEEKRVGWTD